MKTLLLLLGLTTSTFAFAATGGAQSGGIMSLLPMLVIFMVVFYFLLIRPQSKRAKQQRELLSKLTQGDEVVTSGGMVGTIEKVTDDFIVLMISENVNITVQKAAVTTALPKGTLKTIQ